MSAFMKRVVAVSIVLAALGAIRVAPFKAAVADPVPATVLRMAMSIGTGERRTL